jgi:hypothetical protein
MISQSTASCMNWRANWIRLWSVVVACRDLINSDPDRHRLLSIDVIKATELALEFRQPASEFELRVSQNKDSVSGFRWIR